MDPNNHPRPRYHSPPRRSFPRPFNPNLNNFNNFNNFMPRPQADPRFQIQNNFAPPRYQQQQEYMQQQQQFQPVQQFYGPRAVPRSSYMRPSQKGPGAGRNHVEGVGVENGRSGREKGKELKEKTDLVFDDEKYQLVVKTKGFEGSGVLLRIQMDGKFEFPDLSLFDDETKVNLAVVNKVLRPFHLKLIKQTHYYLTDGVEYLVKILNMDNFNVVSGPDNLLNQNLGNEEGKTEDSKNDAQMNKGKLIQELAENDLIFEIDELDLERVVFTTKVEKVLINDFNGPDEIMSAVAALEHFCKQKNWTVPDYWFDRKKHNNIDGFVWTVTIPEAGINFPGGMNIWNSDKEVAKSLAAENVLEKLRSLSGTT